jgi:HlyD family secretion protein
VSFVAREPQFTPPVIYSLEERAKLVFLIEARLDAPGPIRPGMPVDVRPAP